MKIAIVTPYLRAVGGVETFNDLLKSIFEEHKHNVMIISNELLKETFWNRVKIKRYGLEHTIGVLFDRINRKEKFDLVICNGEYGINVHHPRAVVVFHGSYLGYFNAIKDFIPHKNYLRGLKLADIQVSAARDKYVITVSNANKKVLAAQGIIVNAVIPNCINTKLFKKRNMVVSQNGLFISRYDYYGKGIDILERLAAKDIVIKCVTDNKMNHPNLITEMFVSHKKLIEYYNSSSFYIFPSRFESGPFTVLEAMACGCPVVINKVGFGCDIMKEIPEFVVQDNNIDEYVDKIKKVLCERDRLGKKAVNYVNEYHNFNDFKNKWLSLIDSIMDGDIT